MIAYDEGHLLPFNNHYIFVLHSRLLSTTRCFAEILSTLLQAEPHYYRHIFPCFLSTSPREHRQPVNEARQFSFCVLVIAPLPAAASIQRLKTNWGDVEKLCSYLEISDKGLAVGTTFWGYL